MPEQVDLLQVAHLRIIRSSFYRGEGVDPGLIRSTFAGARSIFSMICPTVAVQINGLGFSFQACMNSSVACFKSGTLTKLPRRIAFSLNSLNQRSTRFNQLELVGTKWHTKRGCLFSHPGWVRSNAWRGLGDLRCWRKCGTRKDRAST